jgi:hypothetical protein
MQIDLAYPKVPNILLPKIWSFTTPKKELEGIKKSHLQEFLIIYS